LKAITRPLDLAWTVRHEMLVITTPEEAQASLETRVYKLRKPLDLDKLVADITRNIEPNSWSEVGGPASIEVLSWGAVVIAQTYPVLAQIDKAYVDLLQPIRAKRPVPLPLLKAGAVTEALQSDTILEFIETPLPDVIRFLQDQHEVPFTLDKHALEDVGIGADVPITRNIKGIRLESALTLLLRDLELVWIPDGDGLLITTPERAESQLKLVNYDARELAADPQMRDLIEVVTTTIAPQTWDAVGGPGSARFGIRGTLDVRQTFEVHRQVAELLADLKRARQ
jgi:hypothetical protein